MKKMQNLLLTLLARCGVSWGEINSSDPDLGEPLWVRKDQNLFRFEMSPERWKTWVVLKNAGKGPVQVVFEAHAGPMKLYKHPIIEAGGLVAIRVGPDDVQLRFRRVRRAGVPVTVPGMPLLVDRLDIGDLKKKFPHVPRL